MYSSTLYSNVRRCKSSLLPVFWHFSIGRIARKTPANCRISRKATNTQPRALRPHMRRGNGKYKLVWKVLQVWSINLILAGIVWSWSGLSIGQCRKLPPCSQVWDAVPEMSILCFRNLLGFGAKIAGQSVVGTCMINTKLIQVGARAN